MSSRLEVLGVDSLIAPEIIGNFNEAFGTEISSPEFASAFDVLSLCELVKSIIGISSLGSSDSSPLKPWSVQANDVIGLHALVHPVR
jgi:hypothetical protein